MPLVVGVRCSFRCGSAARRHRLYFGKRSYRSLRMCTDCSA